FMNYANSSSSQTSKRLPARDTSASSWSPSRREGGQTSIRSRGMPTRFRLRQFFLAVATFVPLVAVMALIVGVSLRSRPTLEQVCTLAEARRFEEAEAQGKAYLELNPADSAALLVMAEIALSRPSPEPQRALELLERIRPDSTSQAAWVLVDRG